MKMSFMFVAIAAGVILGAIGLGALYDHRERRRGYTVSVPTDEARDNLRDVKMLHNPPPQGTRAEPS